MLLFRLPARQQMLAHPISIAGNFLSCLFGSKRRRRDRGNFQAACAAVRLEVNRQ
jgi:hypothetical protein